MKAIGEFLTDLNPLWLLAGFAAILVALFATVGTVVYFVG